MEKKEKKPKPPTLNDLLKYEIADELGLTDKVKSTGWRSLTAKESGRIGGIMTKRKKDMAFMFNDDEKENEKSEK